MKTAVSSAKRRQIEIVILLTNQQHETELFSGGKAGGFGRYGRFIDPTRIAWGV